MKIVACDNAANAVESYVSYMKQFGVDKNQLINSKNTMLNYLRGFINRVLANKRNLEPEWKTCSWRDGYTPMTWYFTLYFLPQHRLVVIMAFYSKESKPGVKENRMVVRLTESKIREIVEESVRGILKEVEEGHEWKPVAHNREVILNNGVKVKSLVTLSDSAGIYEIWEDDGCYVCCDMNYYRNNEDYHPMYIFPELLSALKDLPDLPLR